MRWLAVVPFVVALLTPLQPSSAAGQGKLSSQGTVTLKDPAPAKKKTADPNGVVSLEQSKKKKKTTSTTDPNGVASLKPDKDAAKRDKVEKLIDAKKAEDARKRKKVEMLIDASQNKKKAKANAGPVLLPFDQSAQSAQNKSKAKKK
jgi:hypothetical protein